MTVVSCPAERGLFVRERNDGLYTVTTYLMAKMFEELAVNAVVSVVMAAAVFHVIQLQGSFAVFWLVYLAVLVCGIGESADGISTAASTLSSALLTGTQRCVRH